MIVNSTIYHEQVMFILGIQSWFYILKLINIIQTLTELMINVVLNR